MQFPSTLALTALTILFPSTLAAQCDLQVLDAPAPLGSQYLGEVAAIDGEVAVFGSQRAHHPGSPQLGFNTGRAFVARRADGAWSIEQELTHPGVQPGEQFCVDADVDGDTIVVGAWGFDGAGGSDSGAVFVYDFDGEAWQLVQTLEPAFPESAGSFGYSVALEGDLLVVGDTSYSGPGSSNGAVHVHRRVAGQFAHAGTFTPPSVDGIRELGRDLDVSPDGQRVAVGTISGHAFVYTDTGASLVLEAELVSADAAPAGFGRRLSTANGCLVVSRYGAAEIFRRDGTTWTSEHVVSSETIFFGEHVAADGDTVLISDTFDEGIASQSGAAHVYTFDGSAWTWAETLRAPDGDQYHSFGQGLAVRNGDAIVGAWRKDHPGAPDAGGVYLATVGEAASVASYGAGWAGTLGAPTLGIDQAPVLGANVALHVGSSLPTPTVGLLLVGLDAANLPTGLGGTQLVADPLLQPIAVPPAGLDVPLVVHCKGELAGRDHFVQAVLVDPGAAFGLAFSDGLRLTFGK